MCISNEERAVHDILRHQDRMYYVFKIIKQLKRWIDVEEKFWYLRDKYYISFYNGVYTTKPLDYYDDDEYY